MADSPFSAPAAGPVRQEHPVADPARARALLEAIPDDPAPLAALRGRHLVSARPFDAPLLRQLFRLAARYELGELAGQNPLRCRVMSNLFLDGSHCSGRLSFNSAWLRLGGSLLNFERTVEETLATRFAPDEIAELCNSCADLTVLRTADPETFEHMLPLFRVPVISAGDGANEHPTHALADLYTLFKWRPELFQDTPPSGNRLQITLVGDPARTRTIRSFLLLLARFPQAVERVLLSQRIDPGFADGQREELEQAGLRIETVKDLMPTATDMEVARRLLPETDLVYVHHLRAVHIPRMKLVESISYLKPDAMVLSPDIQNEETAHRLNDSAHNGYFAQGRGAVFLRMALFATIMG